MSKNMHVFNYFLCMLGRGGGGGGREGVGGRGEEGEEVKRDEDKRKTRALVLFNLRASVCEHLSHETNERV